MTLHSDVKSTNKGLSKFIEYKNNPAFNIMGLGDEELEHLAYGSTKNWCYKCGLYYDLSPQKYELLPIQGMIQH
ncbi:hypothetical protein OB236_10775 [Paenibacillus sp. WQ 127069]|uniref:Uncharacterized protein n=1 Tax=Paenibacillus baimaensis TaxID=2982185 RepID=A0ABT2UD88_9BACL|nr:hypothetical protein [Paenibacillus sp. WQ 127069]